MHDSRRDEAGSVALRPLARLGGWVGAAPDEHLAGNKIEIRFIFNWLLDVICKTSFKFTNDLTDHGGDLECRI